MKKMTCIVIAALTVMSLTACAASGITGQTSAAQDEETKAVKDPTDGTGNIEYFIVMEYENQDQRDAYLEEAKAAEIEKLSQAEKGNIRYEYYLSTANDHSIILREEWESADDQAVHKESDHYALAMELRDKYVKNSVVDYLGYTAADKDSEGCIEFLIDMEYESKEDRDAYLKEAKEAEIEKLSQAEKGNIRYEYAISTANDHTLLLCEMWESLADQTVHKDSDHYKVAMELKDKYIRNSNMEFLEYTRLGF